MKRERRICTVSPAARSYGSVDEVHPTHLVRDDRVGAARVEADVAGAAPGPDGIEYHPRRAVVHVDLAVRQRAHVHPGVIRRDRDVESVAALRGADRVFEERRATRWQVAHQELAALDVGGEEDGAVARHGHVLDARARHSVRADDCVVAQVHRADRALVARRDVHARRERMEGHAREQRTCVRDLTNHLARGRVDHVHAIVVRERVQPAAVRRQAGREDAAFRDDGGAERLIGRDADERDGARVLIAHVCRPAVGAHADLRRQVSTGNGAENVVDGRSARTARARVARSSTYTLPSASVLTYTWLLSGVTATSNALRPCPLPIAYSRKVEPSVVRSRTSSLLRWMSVANRSRPSSDTATFWIRAPETASVWTTLSSRRSTVRMAPSSRAAIYMQGANGWNATPVSRLPVALLGIESITWRVAVLMT